MAFNTKLKLNDGKFEQSSGNTLTLSGNTEYATTADVRYAVHPTFVDDTEIIDKKYVDDITTAGITGATNGLTKTGQVVVLGGSLTGETNITTLDNDFRIRNAVSDTTSVSRLLTSSIGVGIQGISDANNIAVMQVCDDGTLTVGRKISNTDYNFSMNSGGFLASDNFCGGYSARSLVDCEYVNKLVSGSTGAISGSNGLLREGDNIVLGGALTGDTNIGGNYLLGIHNNKINLTGDTGVNIGGTLSLCTTPTGTGGLLCIDNSGEIQQTSLAAFGGITGATNGLTDCGNQEIGLGGELCVNTQVCGTNTLTLGDLNGVCLSTFNTNDIAFNAKSNGGIYIQSQSGTIASSNNVTNAIGIQLDYDNTFQIFDNRVGSNQNGIVYASDYATNYVDRSLVDKHYVDTVASGLDPKSAVLVATTANITLSGTQTIDGVALSNEDRVLVKDQTNAATNGIYVVTGGTWSRALDFDGTPEGEVTEGSLIPVISGSSNINSSWILITKNPISVGTTDLVFTKFSQLLDVAAGAGIDIGVVGATNNICVNLGTNSGLNTSSGLVVDSSIAGAALCFTNGVLSVNAANCGSVGAIPVGYNLGECLIVTCSDIETALGTPINSANNGLTKLGSNVVLGGALTGVTDISMAGSTSLTFTDTRAATCGIEYAGDYENDFVARSLVTAQYVTGLTTCGITVADNGLTKVGDTVIWGGTLTGDTAILHGNKNFCVKTTGIETIADCSCSYVQPTTIDMYTCDSNSCVSQVDLNNDGTISIVANNATQGLTITSAAHGAIYADDYCANFVDRSLVDKEYVDNQMTGQTLQAVTDNGCRTTNAMVIGNAGSCATGTSALAHGCNVKACGNYSTAMGCNSHTVNIFTVAIGRNVCAFDDYAHAEGDGSHACGYVSHAEGHSTVANFDYAHSEGDSTTACGEASHAEGYSSNAKGDYSHAEGCDTIACGIISHAEGCLSYARGIGSHAEGHDVFAEGIASHAEGCLSEALGNGSHAEGSGTTACGINSHAEGYLSFACGGVSHGEGFNTKASGHSSHAEGCLSIAYGDGSHAEGYETKAYCVGSHAEGNNAVASGGASHAEGNHTNSIGLFSHAEGNYTIACGNCSHASGFYNSGCDNTIAEIGVGADDSNRCNAFEVYCAGGVAMPQLSVATQSNIIYVDSNGLLTTGSAPAGGDVDSAANGLSKSGTTVVLGGTLTGDTYLTGAYDLSFTHTNFNVTAAVCVTGAVDMSSTLNVTGNTDLGGTLDISGVLTLDTVNAGDASTDEVMVIDSSGIVKKVAAGSLGEDNNNYVTSGITSTTTLDDSYYAVLADSTGGSFTITLPASPATGQAYKIKDSGLDALTYNITIDAGSGKTIDGVQTATINTDGGALELVYDGTEWLVLSFVN